MLRFTNLMHHLTLELLQASFFDLKKRAAPGIDDVTWQEYVQDFETRLANVMLHYILDEWIDNWRRECRGDVIVVLRYADDFVIGFQHRFEAERCLRELRERFATYGLTLHPKKTRLIEFGRFAESQRRERGESRPETFKFLGFTHYCGTTRRGWFKVGRKPMAERMRMKLAVIKQCLRRRTNARLEEIGQWLRSVVRGWLQYFAVPGTSKALSRFVTEVIRLWARTIRRHSQRGRRSWPWTRINKLVQHWIPPPKIVHPHPNRRLCVK